MPHHCRSLCLASGSNRKRLYSKMMALSSCDRCCGCCCPAVLLLPVPACSSPGGEKSTLNLPVVPNLPYGRYKQKHMTKQRKSTVEQPGQL